MITPSENFDERDQVDELCAAMMRRGQADQLLSTHRCAAQEAVLNSSETAHILRLYDQELAENGPGCFLSHCTHHRALLHNNIIWVHPAP